MSAAPEVPTESGYTFCGCRDCFDETISSDVTRPELCGLCQQAGCVREADRTPGEPHYYGDCQRDDAYQG